MRKGEPMGKIYIAYGSNMNIEQMAMRCPTAKKIGVGKVKGYELLFKGAERNAYATIEPNQEVEVNVVLWNITEKDEKRLDHYEGYPSFYQKETIPVIMSDGKLVEGMVYVMDQKFQLGMPSMMYFQTIAEGYLMNKIEPVHLIDALTKTNDRMQESMEIDTVQEMEM